MHIKRNKMKKNKQTNSTLIIGFIGITTFILAWGISFNKLSGTPEFDHLGSIFGWLAILMLITDYFSQTYLKQD